MDEIDIGEALTKSIGNLPVPFDWFQNGNPFTIHNGDQLGPAKMIFAFGNLHAIPIRVDYSDVKPAGIPDNVIRQSRTYTNCLPTKKAISDTLTLHKSEGVTITRSTQITTSSSTTVQGNFSVAIYIVNASIGMTKTETVGFSESDSTTINTMTDTTETIQINEEIPPGTVYIVSVEKRLSTDYIDFSGIVEIEGDLLITAVQNGRPTGKYVTLNKLSTYFPQDRRTIILKGQIWNVKGDDTKRVDKEYPADSASNCSNKVLPSSFYSVGKSVENEEFLKITLLSNELTDDGGILTTESLYNGMTIHTGNSIASVQVRAKSMGPGFCRTDVSCGSGSVAILAPPYYWSPWSTLFNSIGKNTTTITTGVSCDTGAVFEVQYYKAQ